MVYSRFNAKVQSRDRMMAMLRGSMKVKRGFRKLLGKKGPTFTIRLKNEIRQALTFSVIFERNQNEEKAK
jgi:hypothetical protein